jgi:hypothetical protein
MILKVVKFNENKVIVVSIIQVVTKIDPIVKVGDILMGKFVYYSSIKDCLTN